MTGAELHEALSLGTEGLSNLTSIKHAQTAALWLTGCSKVSTANSKAACLWCRVTMVTVWLDKSFKCSLTGGTFPVLQFFFPDVKSRNVTSIMWECPTGVVRIPRVTSQRWVVYVDVWPVAPPPPPPQLYITPYRAVGVASTSSHQTIALSHRKGGVQNSLTSGGQVDAADVVNSEFPSSFPAAILRKKKTTVGLSGHDSVGLYIEGALWLSRPGVSDSRRTHLSWPDQHLLLTINPPAPSSHREPRIQPTPAESGK